MPFDQSKVGLSGLSSVSCQSFSVIASKASPDNWRASAVQKWHVIKLEWLSRDNLSRPPFALVTYRHVKNLFTNLLERITEAK